MTPIYLSVRRAQKFTLFMIVLAVAALIPFFGQDAVAADHSSSKTSCLVQRLRQILSRKQAARIQVTSPKEARPSHEIQDLDQLLRSFSEGLVPDLEQKSQRAAFEIYRRMRFGNPQADLKVGSLEEIAAILKQNPKLAKEPFRDYQLELNTQTYPVTRELSSYLDSQVVSASQVKANLFQVDANSGYWKKLFQFPELDQGPADSLPRDASAEEKAAFRKKNSEKKKSASLQWESFLKAKMSSEFRMRLLDSKRNIYDRANELYWLLSHERGEMLARGLDIRPISQAMIDLVHTMGYHDSLILKALKSEDGLERLGAYRKILDERDRFAIYLGYKDHFEQILREMGHPVGVITPNGVPAIGLTKKLSELEQGLRSQPEALNATQSGKVTRIIRHLSLVESPFRSCLGGSDCSSRTYLTRALDPNYHYFTLTDEAGFSTGQITVVLGEGVLNGNQTKKFKVAFIDKVQNVPTELLPEMIEGIRRSFKEKGYILALPNLLGGHNGISNELLIRELIKNQIQKDQNQVITEFKPHAHRYRFPNKFSRAELQLPSRAVSPLELKPEVKLQPGELSLPWTLQNNPSGGGDLNLDQLLETSISLKTSADVQDRLRYVSLMVSMKNAQLPLDPEFESTLLEWIADSNQPFQLRKQALITEAHVYSRPFLELLSDFTQNHRVQMIQNLLDTPRHRSLVLENRTVLPQLIVMTRENKKVRSVLIAEYVRGLREPIRAWIERILDAQDFSEKEALKAISQLKMTFESKDLHEFLRTLIEFKGKSTEGLIRDGILSVFSSAFNREVDLGRAISRFFRSSSASDPTLSLALHEFLRQSEVSKQPDFPILQAFETVSEIQRSAPHHPSFSQAAQQWLQTSPSDPGLKARFILALHDPKLSGSEGSLERFLGVLPSTELSSVLKRMDQSSHFSLFKKISEGSKDTEDLLTSARVESFEFIRFESHPGDGLTESFELQATPVTQLQWYLLMRDNPSQFQKGANPVQLKEGKVRMNPNRPVENVSWLDAQAFVRKLNRLDPNYVYRLPTDFEWEYAARSGTETSYSFGDNPYDLESYGWYHGNSHGRTHDVASLKANQRGLYDMHGNVLEWVEDGGEADQRGVRGGAWDEDADRLRSARKSTRDIQFRHPTVGFRLLRTQKISR